MSEPTPQQEEEMADRLLDSQIDDYLHAERLDEDKLREEDEQPCPHCNYPEGHAHGCEEDRTDYDYELAEDLRMEDG